MSPTLKTASRASSVHHFWKPVAVTGMGGAAVAIWFDEIVLFAEEILALICLPITAGVIYLLDILIFKSRLPKREDLNQPTQQGESK